MRLPEMPDKLRRHVEGRTGPGLFVVLLTATVGLGVADFVDLTAAASIALGVALIAMALREWVMHEQSRDVTEHQRLLVGLERATASSHAAYEEDVEQTWFIEADGRDRGRVVYTTTVTSSDTMAWRRVKVFAAADLPMPKTSEMAFRALEGLAETEAFRVRDSGGMVDYVVFFRTPVVPGHPRQWSVDYVWPHFFDPLRKVGEDQCALEFAKPARRASIRVVFPAGMTDPPATFLRRTPSTGAETFAVVDGRPTLTWTFGPCLPGQTFRVDVRADLRKL